MRGQSFSIEAISWTVGTGTLVSNLSDFLFRYMKLFRFDRISTMMNIAMKKAQLEFKALLGLNYTCVERFVEWKRTK